MANQLADETLATIFFDHFDVSDDDFACITSRQSPFALRPLGSSSNVLLVCKRWMRVATPLLYETVILRSQAQANALAFALKSTPSLGSYIRKLRVEGGFGSAGAKAIEASPNITDLWLTLDLYAQDRAIPMYTAMANRINPGRLLVYGDALPRNANSNKAVELMCEYIPTWSNLRAVYVSTEVAYETPIGRALVAGTHLDVLRLANFHIPLSTTTDFLQDITAQRIELCFACDDLIDAIMVRLQGLSQQKRNSLVIMHQVPRESLTQKAPPAIIEAKPLDPSYVPLADVPEALRNRIWSHVFRLLAEGHDETARRTGYSCLLTSKLFRCLAIPIFCRDVNLKSDRAIIAFSRLLQDRPELASRVRSLAISERPARDPPREWAGPVAGAEACLAFLPVLPLLSHLVHIDLVRVGVSRVQNLYTERLKTARLLLKAADGQPVVLPRFARLTTLTLKTPFLPNKDVRFALAGTDALAALEMLTFVGCGFDGPGLASTLAALPLPRLRVLDVRELGYPGHGADWAPFARAHGAKLRALLVPPSLLADTLPHCPHVVELRVLGTDPGGDPIAIPTDAFNGLQPLAALETLVCPGFWLDVWPLLRPRAKIMKPFNAWFEYLACSDARRVFPALRTVRVDEAELWPTTEREIAKSTIARCAETLLTHGVAMYDRNGLGWKPRLKTSRKKDRS